MSKPKLKISAAVENGKGVIRIDGYISDWNNYSDLFKQQLDQLINAGLNQADVWINSGGGNCFQANQIVNEMKSFKGALNGHLGAMCCSAASYIASHLDTVEAAPNTSYMIHKPSGQLEGTYDEIIAGAKGLLNIQNEYAKTYAAKTGMSIDKINQLWQNDYWMNAEEARKLGFIDSISGEDAPLSQEELDALMASGYKNIPQIKATLKPQQNSMKEILITALAMAAGSSEAQIVAQIENLKAKAAKADEYKTQLDAAKLEAATSKIEAELNIHQEKKRFTPEARGFWKKSLESDFAGTKAVLDKMPAAVKLSGVTEGSGKAVDRSGWTYADYMEKDSQALAEMAQNDEPTYKALFKDHYGREI